LKYLPAEQFLEKLGQEHCKEITRPKRTSSIATWRHVATSARPRSAGLASSAENLAVQLAITTLLEFSVHIASNGHSAQNGKSDLHRTETASEQKPVSLLWFQSDQSSQSEVGSKLGLVIRNDLDGGNDRVAGPTRDVVPRIRIQFIFLRLVFDHG